jgi:hypothetical protein
LAADLISSVQRGEQVKTKITLGKLTMISALIDLPLFRESESRRVILPVIFEHLNEHLLHHTQVTVLEPSVVSLSKILNYMHQDKDSVRDILGYTVALLPAISNGVLGLKSTPPAYLEAITCLLNIYHVISPLHFTKFIEKQDPSDSLVSNFLCLSQSC